MREQIGEKAEGLHLFLHLHRAGLENKEEGRAGQGVVVEGTVAG